MNPLIETTSRILSRQPAGTLPLSRLAQLLARELHGPAPNRQGLLREIRIHPHLFRILEPWKGEWPPGRGIGEDYQEALEREGLAVDLWVGVTRPPFGPMGTHVEGAASDILRRMQESLIAFGKLVDENSRMAHRRWLRLVHESQAVFRRLS